MDPISFPGTTRQRDMANSQAQRLEHIETDIKQDPPIGAQCQRLTAWDVARHDWLQLPVCMCPCTDSKGPGLHSHVLLPLPALLQHGTPKPSRTRICSAKECAERPAHPTASSPSTKSVASSTPPHTLKKRAHMRRTMQRSCGTLPTRQGRGRPEVARCACSTSGG